MTEQQTAALGSPVTFTLGDRDVRVTPTRVWHTVEGTKIDLTVEAEETNAVRVLRRIRDAAKHGRTKGELEGAALWAETLRHIEGLAEGVIAE